MTLNLIKMRPAKIAEVNQWLEWDYFDLALESLGGEAARIFGAGFDAPSQNLLPRSGRSPQAKKLQR